jgi:hypothetical protein
VCANTARESVRYLHVNKKNHMDPGNIYNNYRSSLIFIFLCVYGKIQLVFTIITIIIITLCKTKISTTHGCTSHFAYIYKTLCTHDFSSCNNNNDNNNDNIIIIVIIISIFRLTHVVAEHCTLSCTYVYSYYYYVYLLYGVFTNVLRVDCTCCFATSYFNKSRLYDDYSILLEVSFNHLLKSNLL